MVSGICVKIMWKGVVWVPVEMEQGFELVVVEGSEETTGVSLYSSTFIYICIFP